MRIAPLLALAALLGAAPPALGQTNPLRRQIEAELRRDQCTMTRYALAWRGQMPGEARPVSVVTYSYEGCGGGNNWASVLGVFLQEGGRHRQVPLPRGATLPDVVERVGVADGRILVEGVSYGPDDPRCCPSQRRRAAFVLQDGRLAPAR